MDRKSLKNSIEKVQNEIEEVRRMKAIFVKLCVNYVNDSSDLKLSLIKDWCLYLQLVQSIQNTNAELYSTGLPNLFVEESEERKKKREEEGLRINRSLQDLETAKKELENKFTKKLENL